ncbi:MAG: anti-virulence regulator CigR family protein [Gammaproteobacteria bacterium]|nr:anti-virulence regulator CigR family protein [Gammaproteobacteria bacterium]MDH5344625.1 anti-virulence regulator CigR family protein [Gammaproteobacteria bacterium]
MNRRAFLITTAASVTIGWSRSALPADIGIDVRFSSEEISVIRAWYVGHGGKRKPELKNGRSLPPGIARNLERGKTLPPGIAKQALPTGLVDKLPPAATGHERIVVDGKVLLVEIATGIVRDVLTDIVVR